MNDLINAAYDGSEPRLSLSRETGRTSQNPTHNPVTLLSQDGEPFYAFAEQWFGEAYAPILGFICQPDRQIQIHLVFKKSTLSDATEINPSANHTVLIRPFDTNLRAEVPVEFGSWFDLNHRRYASFVGTISADHPLIRNIEDTSNLQFDLRENGENTYYRNGVEVDDADSHLRPLLDHCGGYEAPTPEPLPEVSLWTPSAEEIAWALQTELDEAVRRFDAMREQCNNVSQSGDPIAALACLTGTLSGISSDQVSFTVNSVELDRCIRTVSDRAFCNYRVDADIRGSSVAAQLAQNAQNFAETVGNYGWGSFDMIDGRWHLERVYIDCTLGETDINCRYES